MLWAAFLDLKLGGYPCFRKTSICGMISGSATTVSALPCISWLGGTGHVRFLFVLVAVRCSLDDKNRCFFKGGVMNVPFLCTTMENKLVIDGRASLTRSGIGLWTTARFSFSPCRNHNTQSLLGIFEWCWTHCKV